MREITELDNPNSVAQMKQWLCDNGLETDTLDKKVVAELLKTAPEPLGRVLLLRQQSAKSSVKKYQAMVNAVCTDGRARGMFQFYGANRTGRWAGRLIQMQNLPQNHIPDLEQARELVKHGDFAAMELLYDSVPEVLSELIRTAFVPKDGRKLVVADFSAIEARVIAWFAGETWRNEVFATHGKIYEASASQMFRVPIEEVVKGSPLRQKGKIAELALGYGGSVGALKAMGALEMGLEEDELQPLVLAWRSSNPNIVRLWWDVDRAAMTAVRDKTIAETHGVKFEYQSAMLFITLPSGRRLCYVKPRIGCNQFGSPCVTYEGVGATKKWERLDSYGPKFVENIVQATSRDILCYAMQAQRCCDIVMHVHDEIVIEADLRMSTKVLCEQMSRTPPWAEGLLLRADGYDCSFYKKD
jgi:DNA polymerase